MPTGLLTSWYNTDVNVGVLGFVSLYVTKDNSFTILCRWFRYKYNPRILGYCFNLHVIVGVGWVGIAGHIEGGFPLVCFDLLNQKMVIHIYKIIL